ncbi:MAG: hypothetical protein F6K23_07005 [Okeania sp. SIO2C9]|uniref:hemopexin repeat-containing protein n=1 Tax=Okeania sp. SIO2C9 TaxID=2607791 RepID=UPI0013C0422D|nr:hemopexin repeat-containing protein [Okeania sp. SIO2C9]NEQ72841.1 hypothetical protein [Okeania sp. SIO2C9]
MKYLVQPLVQECAVAPGPEINDNRVYSMTAVHSGKAMTVKDDNSIVQQTWAEEDRQRWKMEFLSSSYGPSGIDAVFNWESRNDAYFFKKNSYIRYDLKSDKTDSGYPKRIFDYWPGMPSNFSQNIDAILYWPQRDGAYFFKGSEYVKYNLKDDRAEPGYPKPIADYWPGMPSDFCQDIDAVFYWPQRDSAYFFKGSRYVKYNLKDDHAESGYPKSISGYWDYMPSNFHQDIDAIFHWPQRDSAYFFKGNQYLTSSPA